MIAEALSIHPAPESLELANAFWTYARTETGCVAAAKLSSTSELIAIATGADRLDAGRRLYRQMLDILGVAGEPVLVGQNGSELTPRGPVSWHNPIAANHFCQGQARKG